MALLHSMMVPLGTAAIDFNLPGVDGKTYSLGSFSEDRVLVIIFMCNHCPYVKAVMQRLIELQEEGLSKGVRFVGINCNDAEKYPDDSFESMKSVANEWRMNFPYLFDESQTVARKYDAVCTPDIYVYGSERKLLYRGRIDDNWGNQEQVTQRDLKKAIECILTNQDISMEQIPSMGCSIKWKVS
ncbi:MAG: thioredoxin family protein [Nitrospina sp.]|jgi:peroxiredoxin|nr:thioredoxin family protein [Nitrospina sp.]MBT6717034.1 thioredoxin family protein [Nitrospina sp.]